MKRLNLIFLPIFVAATLVVRFGLFGSYTKLYFLMTISIAGVFRSVRADWLRKWIKREYPEVAEAHGGLNESNVLRTTFILRYDDGDRRLRSVNFWYIVLNILAVIWAIGGVFIISAFVM